MGGFLSGRSQANMITRTTAILATGFFITSLVLAYGDHRVRGNTQLVPATSTTAPAAPSAPASQQPAAPATNAPAAPSSDSGATGGATAPAAPAQPAQPAAPSGQ
jgi:preprotein translocase subunit SecG